MTSVTIPNSVTSIDYGAFFDCRGLTSVTIPNSVTEIGSSAFCQCDGLTSVTIPNSVTSIGSSAFLNCTGLTSVEIPNSVTSIGSHAFYCCRGLTSVTIPNSVTSIGEEAFSECTHLTSVYYAATEPIDAASNVFTSTAYSNATLYVPEEAVEKCKQIDPWKKFTNIEAHDFTGVDAIEDDAVVGEEPCEIYNLNGVMVGTSTENLRPGLYIVRQGGNVKKITVK